LAVKIMLLFVLMTAIVLASWSAMPGRPESKAAE
jgi:hypothetical protein